MDKGESPAVATAKTVIASALRAMGVLQEALNKNKIADMSVPECAIPTQNTKLIKYVPHTMGCLMPSTPMPVAI